VLERELAAAGAAVRVVAAYETRASTRGTARLSRLLEGGFEGAVLVASASAVDAFHALVRGRLPRGVWLAAIGPVTARRARELGYAVGAVARTYTGPGLVRALEERMRGRATPRRGSS
jgi:uroporphyrinogen-III synthase